MDQPNQLLVKINPITAEPRKVSLSVVVNTVEKLCYLKYF